MHDDCPHGANFGHVVSEKTGAQVLWLSGKMPRATVTITDGVGIPSFMQ